ncbi:MAG: sugar transferase [Bacteroidales bacterium]|nr:sugar transferase [Bacteroidales bacterium]
MGHGTPGIHKYTIFDFIMAKQSFRRTLIYLLIDILIVAVSFLFFIWLKPASKRIYLPTYFPPFVFFLFLWLAVSLAIDKYRLHKKQTLRDLLFPIMAGDFIIFSATIFLIVFFQQFQYSRMIVFGTMGLAFLLEVFFSYVYYYNRNLSRDAEHFDEFAQARINARAGLLEPGEVEKMLAERKAAELPPINQELIIRESGEEALQFIEKHIEAEYRRNLVISTTTPFNIQSQHEGVFEAIVNLRCINDFKRVNKFFEAVNSRIPVYGLYINCAITNEIRKQRIMRKYPPVLNGIYYFFHYVFMRIFPKLPVTKRFYFWITNGYNRAISKAETFGRLYSCGFELVEEQQIGDRLYFVARKIQEPAFDYHPTYGPLVRLKRVGKNGKTIYVYKMRTMHPYSEYLQDYVYKTSSLQDGGKFRSDFRVSTVGRIMRKLWIDELPMLVNMLRGDLKLVGIRPLSFQYFELYNEDLKVKRIKTRPGLIPPFYADMPKTLEEIQASEDTYLDAYFKSPFLTDWKYFWKALYNIVIRKARSN